MKPLSRSLIQLTCAALMTLPGLQALADDGISGSGVIRYFGSVVIDGDHLETAGAVIRINGRPAAEAELKVGYHVRYRADGSTLQAWSLDYYDTVAGAVEAIAVEDDGLQLASIRILGQRIETDADTWFHGVELEEIEPGMPLAVSAEWTPEGVLRASSVDAAARTENVLSGPVSRVDEGSLLVGGIRIQASDSVLTPNGVPVQAGEWIHALGHYDGDGALYADRIVRQADPGIAELPARVEGVLRRENGGWWLRDHLLRIDGAAAGDLLAGARVTLAGTLETSGAIRTRTVRRERRGRHRLDGVIEAIHADGSAITVAGRTVALDGRTSFRDDRDEYRWLGPDSLGVHDAVSLILENEDGTLRARRVVRRAGSERVLSAIVEGVSWWRGPSLLDERQGDAYNAHEAFYNGRRVSPRQLRWLIRTGDAMTLTWDAAGRVARADIRSGRADIRSTRADIRSGNGG